MQAFSPLVFMVWCRERSLMHKMKLKAYSSYLGSLTPINSSPLFAVSTSSSNARPSALVHLVSPSSSELLPERIAISNADLRALSSAMRRGSECPVKMTTAVRGGSDS